MTYHRPISPGTGIVTELQAATASTALADPVHLVPARAVVACGSDAHLTKGAAGSEHCAYIATGFGAYLIERAVAFWHQFVDHARTLLPAGAPMRHAYGLA